LVLAHGRYVLAGLRLVLLIALRCAVEDLFEISSLTQQVLDLSFYNLGIETAEVFCSFRSLKGWEEVLSQWFVALSTTLLFAGHA